MTPLTDAQLHHVGTASRSYREHLIPDSEAEKRYLEITRLVWSKKLDKGHAGVYIETLWQFDKSKKDESARNVMDCIIKSLLSEYEEV